MDRRQPEGPACRCNRRDHEHSPECPAFCAEDYEEETAAGDSREQRLAKCKETPTLGDVLTMPDGTWRVDLLCVEAFKGTVIERSMPTLSRGGLYRYQIVGVLITDQRLDFEPGKEIALAGEASGLGAAVEGITRGCWSTFKGQSGLNADQVLLRLDEIEPA